LKNYFAILTQSEDDKKRFIAIGANPATTGVMGNMKFDIEKPYVQVSDLNLGKNRLIIAGSTHRGEDEVIIKTYQNLKKRFSDLKLLIAPRHLERVCAIQSLVKCALKSQDDFKNNDILILDTTGELKNLYSIAHSAFIGGSFNETGGHNPLEATIWGIPVLSGNNVKNFKLIYKVLSELNCAKTVKTQQELEAEFAKLLSDNEYYKNAQTNCKDVFEKKQGCNKIFI
jgi:3-deoxy-D-manno-octulosonic-acid transferase